MVRAAGAPPDVLLVVLDCARASDFATGAMPFVDELRRESEEYPRAIAPAPWTVPSHATLFTGLYPWEHGCHAKSGLKLDPERPKLPAFLAGMGYRTLALSANHLVCPELGLADGFDRAAWAGWWEPYLRLGGVELPPHAAGSGPAPEAAPGRIGRSGPVWQMIKRTSRLAYRYPFMLDGLGRVTTRFRTGDGVRGVPVSPWIEPTFERWVATTPRDQPLFTFVNLLETHEPYYPDPEIAPDLLRWWHFSRLRQDHVGWLAGRWEPTAEEYDLLHGLYRRSFAAADRRLRRLATVLKAHDRWDDTLVIVTSDHGQSFGEQGMLFHMLRLDEPLLRVPLLVRRPKGASAGARATGWASLVDIAPTIMDAAGQTGALVTSGRPLDRMLDAPRPEPVFAAADGLVWKTIVPEHERANLSETRLRTLDRVMACGYLDDLKVIYDMPTGRASAFDVVRDPGERTDLLGAGRPEGRDLAEELPVVARRMVAHTPTDAAPDVEDRLRSWGYL